MEQQDDLFGQLEQKLNDASKPTASSVKIGDRDIPLSDTAALQQAIDEMNERSRREIDAYKQIVNQRDRQYVEPETHQQTQQTQPPPPPQWNQQQPPITPTRQRWTVEEYVEQIKRDPEMVHDEALARAMGLAPGVKASDALKGILAVNMGMAQRLEQIEQQRAAEAKERAEQAMEQAGINFVDSHPDYEPSEANSIAIGDIMSKYNLPVTAGNLHLAYLEAVTNGKIVAKQQAQQVQQNPGNPGLPSLRNSQASPSSEMDFNSWNNRLNQLPTEQSLKILRELWPKDQGY